MTEYPSGVPYDEIESPMPVNEDMEDDELQDVEDDEEWEDEDEDPEEDSEEVDQE